MDKESKEKRKSSYFNDLASGAGKINIIINHAIVLVIMSVLGVFATMQIKFWCNNDFSSMLLFYLSILFLVFAVFLNILSWFIPNKFLYRHQVFSSSCILISLIVEQLIFILIGFVLINSRDNPNEPIGVRDQVIISFFPNFNDYNSKIYLILVCIGLFCSFLYATLENKRKMRLLSEKIPSQKISLFFRKKIFRVELFIFIIGMILSWLQGKTIVFLGACMMIVVAVVYPKYIFNLAYLTYLKKLDKRYWETEEKIRNKQNKGIKKAKKKNIK